MKPARTFGGYCYLPEHPLSDMHGIIRFCIRTDSPLRVRDSVNKYGVRLFSLHSHFWGESLSHVEHEVTERHHGDVFFCSPAKAYLSVENYHHDHQLMLAFREEAQRLAKVEGHKVASAPRRSPRSEFP